MKTNETDGMGQSTATPKRKIVEFQTRFLYPFFFTPNAVEQASTLLQKLSLKDDSSVWCCGERDALYEEETLPHVARFLFPHKNGMARCNYLEVQIDELNRIFHSGLLLELSSDRKLLIQHTNIEVFFNDHGVGVLSLNLSLIGDEFTAVETVAFNYRLVQPRQKSPQGLRQAHPDYEPEQFAKMPIEQKQKQKPPPSDASPLQERLGVRGGRFWLVELAQVLLDPLKGVGFRPVLSCDMIQAQFWIYTVARLDESVNWAETTVRNEFAPFISALAQVEEPGTAGAIDDDLGVPSAVMNSKHWVAVGLMGAVHLIADQPDDHPFNSARSGRVMRKYFVPHLMALFQRLVLQRAMAEASALVKSPEAAFKLAALRQSLLEFGVGGHFGQVSSRHSVQRFYSVAEEGLRVNPAWQDVRQAIDDLDARFTVEQTLKLSVETRALAEGQKRATEQLIQLQSAVHWIEVFIVSVYSADLWHMFASEKESLHKFVSDGVVICAILGGLSAWFFLKPGRHRVR